MFCILFQFRNRKSKTMKQKFKTISPRKNYLRISGQKTYYINEWKFCLLYNILVTVRVKCLRSKADKKCDQRLSVVTTMYEKYCKINNFKKDENHNIKFQYFVSFCDYWLCIYHGFGLYSIQYLISPKPVCESLFF